MSNNINKHNIDEEIFNLILDSVWIMRWNSNQTALSAVLTDKEAIEITNDIISALKDKDYEIVKK